MGRTVLLQVENIDYDALQTHFNMPMADAAKKFGVSLTLFKSICRRNGIQRWPHRKLRSLQNKIADLQTRLEDHPNAVEHQLRRRLDELQGADGTGLNTTAWGPANCAGLLPDGDGMPGSSEPVNPAVSTKPAGGANTSSGPNFTYEELRKHFYLPLTEAAKHSGVSSTVFKKICRKNGIRKWPHRKLKSLQSKIIDLQSRIASNQGAQESELKRRLDELKCLDTTNEDGHDVCQLFSLNQFIAPTQPAAPVQDAVPVKLEELDEVSAVMDADLMDEDFVMGMTDAELDQGMLSMVSESPLLRPMGSMSRVQSVEMLCEMINGSEQSSGGGNIPRILSTDALCDMEKYAPPMSRVQSAEALCDMQEAGMITCWVGPEGWNDGFMSMSPAKDGAMQSNDVEWRSHYADPTPGHLPRWGSSSSLARLDELNDETYLDQMANEMNDGLQRVSVQR